MFSFASFDFDPQQMILWRGGEQVPLGRREAAILRLLLERRGQVVAKHDLMDAAWPGLAMEESNLSVQVAQLRRRLGGDLIRTIERVGYQFVDPASLSTRSGAAVFSGRSIMVRPFAFSGATPDLAATAEQLVDDLTVGLVRFTALTVIAHAPSAWARYVIGGSVRVVATTLRITVRLLDATSGATLWADTFTAGATDLAKACDELLPRIVATIDAETQTAEIGRARRERPDGQHAYDLYLRAQFLLRSSSIEDNAAATALYEQAIALEPENVAYLAGACEAMHHRIAVGWPALGPDDAQRCQAYAHRGIRLARDDGDSVGLFGIALLMTGDPDFGYATMQRGAALNPNSVLATLIAGQANFHWGDLDQAEAQLRRALWLNPRDHNQRFVFGTLARVSLARGQAAEAFDLAHRAFAINQHYASMHWTLIATAAHLGRADQAHRYLARFRQGNPSVTLARIAGAQPSVRNRNVPLLEGLESAGLR